MSHTFPRSAYADMFGPTTGDRVRLADTDLVVRVERDFATYGDEIAFGGGDRRPPLTSEARSALRG